jgi:hypothetical protein
LTIPARTPNHPSQDPPRVEGELAMTVSRADLEQRFAGFDDEELLRRYRSGDLSELAHEVMRAELVGRGLEPPECGADARRAGSGHDQPPAGDLLILTRFFSPTEAHLLRGLLDAQGIPAFVADGNLVQANPFLTVAVGGVRVMVPESHFRDAQALLKRFNAGEFALSDDENSGDPEVEGTKGPE